MSTIQRQKICDEVNFVFIRNNKFKTTRISFNMFLPLDKSTVSTNAILVNVLERSCKKYPDFISFNKKLEELYSSTIFSGVDKLGENQIISLSAECINDDLTINHESIVSEVASLLCDVIFSPHIEGDKFKDDDVSQECRQLIETIDAEFNDKRAYAKNRCEQLMCENEKFGINKYGDKENVKSVTPSNLYQAWKHVLKSSHIEIIMIGSSPYEPIYKLFKESFQGINRGNIVECGTEIISASNNVKEFNDSMDVIQCKLVMGLRTNIAVPNKNVTAMRLMVALLGGTPHSKLFLNVREKLSLCYYCSSSYNRYKGIVIIESGVEKENIEKAKKEILNQLEDIKQGKFSDGQLDATRMSLTQSCEKIEDSIGAIDDWYTFQTLSEEVKSPQEISKEINNVKREDIISAANSLVLDTVYTLTGNGENDI